MVVVGLNGSKMTDYGGLRGLTNLLVLRAGVLLLAVFLFQATLLLVAGFERGFDNLAYHFGKTTLTGGGWRLDDGLQQDGMLHDVVGIFYTKPCGQGAQRTERADEDGYLAVGRGCGQQLAHDDGKVGLLERQTDGLRRAVGGVEVVVG